MILYPAMDLLDGRVVRLKQGDFNQVTEHGDDPARALAEFAAAGAAFAHIVDLSGARDPAARQTALIGRLLKGAPTLRAQTGGGVRTMDDVAGLLAAGADRVVIGSALATNPDFVRAALREFGPARLTFAVDVRLENDVPMALIHGWRESSGLSFAQLMEPYWEFAPERVLCTDVGVDGMMTGPNTALYERLMRAHPSLKIQASGGVSSLADVRRLSAAGLESAVVGKALYVGAFRLEEALAAC